jgi:hypothetical protein
VWIKAGIRDPHPYFVNKILVFFDLRVWLRCKIIKTKELFAKSSSERSYAHFLPLPAAFGWKAARKQLARTMIGEKPT